MGVVGLMSGDWRHVYVWRWCVVFILVNLVLVRSWARRTSRVARLGPAQAGCGGLWPEACPLQVPVIV